MTVVVNYRAVRRSFRMLGSAIGSALLGFIQSGSGAVARDAQSKMREWVSVTDFGASPSASAAENMVAFNAAAAASGRNILIPPGIFALSGPWTVVNRNIIGHGCGASVSDAASILGFPAGTSGVLLQGGSIREVCVASASSGATTGTGIHVQGHAALVERCVVQAFGLYGVYVDGTSGFNCNNSLIRNTRALQCFTDGFRCEGSDANAVTFDTCDATLCTRYGFYSGSANTMFMHPHAADNGTDFYEASGANIWMLPYSEGPGNFEFAVGTSGAMVTCGSYGKPNFTGAYLRHLVYQANDSIPGDGYGGMRIEHQTAALEVLFTNASNSIRTHSGLKYDTLKLTQPAALFQGPAVTAAASEVSFGNGTATTVGAAGGAAALPATPTGYLVINVAGTAMKVPYYAS
jgi:hypothetical protein